MAKTLEHTNYNDSVISCFKKPVSHQAYFCIPSITHMLFTEDQWYRKFPEEDLVHGVGWLYLHLTTNPSIHILQRQDVTAMWDPGTIAMPLLAVQHVFNRSASDAGHWSIPPPKKKIPPLWIQMDWCSKTILVHPIKQPCLKHTPMEQSHGWAVTMAFSSCVELIICHFYKANNLHGLLLKAI